MADTADLAKKLQLKPGKAFLLLKRPGFVRRGDSIRF